MRVEIPAPPYWRGASAPGRRAADDHSLRFPPLLIGGAHWSSMTMPVEFGSLRFPPLLIGGAHVGVVGPGRIADGVEIPAPPYWRGA